MAPIQEYRKYWEHLPEFKGWLSELSGDKLHAYCMWCNKKLNAHKRTLLDHRKSNQHICSNKSLDLGVIGQGSANESNFSLKNDPNELHNIHQFGEIQTTEEIIEAKGVGDVELEIGLDNSEHIKERKPKIRWGKYEKRYKSHWQEDPKLKGWVEPLKDDAGKVTCKYCNCMLRAHRTDLYKHSGTRKHKANSKNIKTGWNERKTVADPVKVNMKKKVKVEKLVTGDGSYIILQSGHDIFGSSPGQENENIFVDYNSESIQTVEIQSETFAENSVSEDSKINDLASRIGRVLVTEIEKILVTHKNVLKPFRENGEISINDSNVRNIAKICIGHLSQRFLVESALNSGRNSRSDSMTKDKMDISSKFKAIEDKLQKTVTEMRELKMSLSGDSDLLPFSSIDLGDLLKNASAVE